MKILILIDSLEIGGAETHVELLCLELASMGHEIFVVSRGGKIESRLIKNKIQCFRFSKITKCKKTYADLSLFEQLIITKAAISKLIQTIKPEIVHAHTRKTAFLAHKICQKYKIPLIVTAHAKFSMKFPKNILSRWGVLTIAVSEDIKKHLQKYGVPTKQIKIIPNGVKLPQNHHAIKPDAQKEIT